MRLDRAIDQFSDLIGAGAFEVAGETFIGGQKIQRPARLFGERPVDRFIQRRQLVQFADIDAVRRIGHDHPRRLLNAQITNILLLEHNVFIDGKVGED